MKAYTDGIGSWLAGAAVPSKLKVVIAYADLSSATLAKRILHEALAVLSLQFTVETSLWKFELLQAPSLQQLAMEDAAQAQIIIIAAEREYGLPEGAKKWVETCLTNPEVKDVSVVALLRDDQGDSLDASAKTSKLSFSGLLPMKTKAANWPRIKSSNWLARFR
jgi:hypothetical protein